MTDYTDLQKAAEYAAQDTIKFADEDEEMRALQQFHEEVNPETVLALIAENDSQRKDLQNLRTDNAQLIYALKQQEQSYLVLRDERDQLRAEVAGLKTGYEAYERVNAELKAENEALRKDLESHKRMLLAAACDLGAIGEALGAEMDDDGSELEGIATQLRKDAERLQSATAFVQKLCDSAGKQPSVATGYLHDILSAMGKDGRP